MRKEKNRYRKIFDHPEYVVAHKPAGLLSVPERFTDQTSLKRLLMDRYGEIYTVHRLDQYTSGLIVFAKNQNSHKMWNKMFEDRLVTKKYLAITTGRFQESEGMIDLPIMKLPDQNRVVIHKRGKPSQTGYQVLEQMRNHAFVELDLHTGRTHQIRVHLMALGNPLLIDPVYGSDHGFYVSEVKGKDRYHLEKGTIEHPLLTRTPLHAHYLSYTDPFDDEAREFKMEMPKDMRATLYQLQKWDK